MVGTDHHYVHKDHQYNYWYNPNNGNQILHAIKEYIIKMGPNCKITRVRGISGKMIYRNIYTTFRWINQNIMCVSHMSCFYTPTLYIVECLMS